MEPIALGHIDCICRMGLAPWDTLMNVVAVGRAVSCECDQALCTMLLMHNLFTVLFSGSECRWLLKPVAAVSGQCSKSRLQMRRRGCALRVAAR